MRVLVACEESQEVCKAFRALGHEAYSCDIQECSGGHPEWHIMGDCLPILGGRCDVVTMDGEKHTIPGKWDLIIAHPPCTKTSNAGAKHLWRGHKLNIPRYYEGLCGKALFMAIWAADCDRVVIENPTPSAVFDFPPPSQAIQPYEHGHPVSKKTLLWERGVSPLKPSCVVSPKANCHEAGTWFMKGGKERQKNRSKTFPGIARAMAEQWGGTSMSDCIFREAALKALCADCCAKECDKELCQDYHNISVLPAADVRPVVFCRDCRYWSTGIAYETSGYCTHDEPHQIRKAGFYCANGKEREDG